MTKIVGNKAGYYTCSLTDVKIGANTACSYAHSHYLLHVSALGLSGRPSALVHCTHSALIAAVCLCLGKISRGDFVCLKHSSLCEVRVQAVASDPQGLAFILAGRSNWQIRTEIERQNECEYTNTTLCFLRTLSHILPKLLFHQICFSGAYEFIMMNSLATPLRVKVTAPVYCPVPCLGPERSWLVKCICID